MTLLVDVQRLCREWQQPLATLFWLCSFGTLYLRTAAPWFRQLANYGGRVVDETASAHKSAPSIHSDPRLEHRPLQLFAQAVVSLCNKTPLVTVRISRGNCFRCFYVVGVVSCCLVSGGDALSQSDGSGVISQLASSGALWFKIHYFTNRLFLLHCLRRLGECLLVHKFHPFERDNVSLFATVAGAVFYVFAAISCVPPDVKGMACRNQAWSSAGDVAACVVYGSCAVIQAAVHHALAQLRDSPRSSETFGGRQQPNRDEGESSFDARVRSYRFPGSLVSAGVASDGEQHHYVCSLFRLVLEPHYLCEVLMYAVIAVRLTCLRGVSPLQQLNALLVTIFSFVNLGITAAEHRRFWLRVNARRRELRLANPESASTLPDEQLPRWNILPMMW